MMARQPWAFLPWVPGTNCHHEMADGFVRAGARAQIVPLDQINRPKLYEADLIGLAGGFSHGDHFGAGRVAAIDYLYRLRDELMQALERGIPILGVCNGFQLQVAMGLLPTRRVGEPTAALDQNLSGQFEHWRKTKFVLHEPAGVDCVWMRGLAGREIFLPVAHGEGRLVLAAGTKSPHVVATYGTFEGTTEYPLSPSGSPIAGVCDDSGKVMGLMPHPERAIDELRGGTDGLAIFESGVNAVR